MLLDIYHVPGTSCSVRTWRCQSQQIIDPAGPQFPHLWNEIIATNNHQTSLDLTTRRFCSFLSRTLYPKLFLNKFLHTISQLEGEIYSFLYLKRVNFHLGTTAFIISKRERTWSYLYSNDHGLVGPKRLLGSHFDSRHPNPRPWHQEALPVNMHNGNLLRPIQDVVAQRCCTIPLENKTDMFS